MDRSHRIVIYFPPSNEIADSVMCLGTRLDIGCPELRCFDRNEAGNSIPSSAGTSSTPACMAGHAYPGDANYDFGGSLFLGCSANHALEPTIHKDR